MDWIIFLVILLWAANRTDSPRKKKRYKRTNKEWNKLVLWCIPIFWPFLIIGTLLKDKTTKSDTTPFDYEHHLRCNGK